MNVSEERFIFQDINAFLTERRKSFASHVRSPRSLALSSWKHRFVSWIYGRRGTRQKDDSEVFGVRSTVNSKPTERRPIMSRAKDLYRLNH